MKSDTSDSDSDLSNPAPQIGKTSGFELALALGIGFVGGFCVWFFSDAITGRAEPWDAPIGYYWIGIGGSGFLAGLVSGRHLWTGVVGVLVGQLFVGGFLVQPQPNWQSIFLSPFLFGFIPSLLGSALGAWARLLYLQSADSVTENEDVLNE